MDIGSILILYCVLIVMVSVAGGLLPLAAGLTHTRLQVYLSFAAGVMLGTAFFHMLPEGVELLGDRGESLELGLTWLTIGLLGLFFVERFFAFHHHEVPAAEHVPTNLARAPSVVSRPKAADLSWGAATIGLCVHTLASGVALASAVAAGHAQTRDPIGLWVFLAVVLHKPADALTIVTMMLYGGAKRRWAYAVNLGFSLVVPLGVGLFFLGRQFFAPGIELPFTGGVLAFSAGTFLCIALSDLLPELQFHEHDRLKLSASLLLGVALMFVASRAHAF